MTATALRVSSAPQAIAWDLLLVAVGYEARSRQVAELFGLAGKRRLGLSFESHGRLSFDENRRVLDSLKFDILPIGDDLPALLADALGELPTDLARVAIDISCFTKFHLAQIVEVVREHSRGALEVDFLYSPASSDGWKVNKDPIEVAEPIHPAFASWIDDPSWPLAAVIGLGVEENLALGAAEYLDVSAVYAFAPAGSDSGFDKLSDSANHEFFLADYVVRSATYDLMRPFDLFTRLESLIYGLRTESRIAVVPLGPKMFALCALLATLTSDRATTVWRFSIGTPQEPSDVLGTGMVTSLRVSVGQN